jgi:predicted dehydrogenase
VLKLALLGCGAISQWHRRACAGLPQIRITACIDVDVRRARAAAKACHATAYDSLSKALSRGDFDAVDVMLPHDLHESVALEVFAAHKHLLLEKPMAPTVEACDRILVAARQAERVFMVGETAQYWPEVIAARDLIREGRIGRVLEARAIAKYPPSDEFYAHDSWRTKLGTMGGGLAIDTAPHFVRALRMLCGEFVAVTAVFGRPYERLEGESHVRALLRTGSGALASLELLLTEAPLAPAETFRVTGSEGEIIIDGDGVRVYDVARPEGWIAVRAQPLQYFGGFSGELEDFAAAVLDGRELAAPPEMARDEVRIAHAMRLAAETQTWQAL